MTVSTETLPPTMAQNDAEASLEHVAGIVDSGAQAVMLSIGHRTGLFDTMARMPPATSARIADEAGLAERYVREWLAVMVTAGIVDYEPAGATYHLPAGYADCLTRGAAMGNMAVYAQIIPLMGAIQEQILQCFETGEGTKYDDYPCFHRFMAEDSEQTVVAQLFDTILPLADGIIERLQAGIRVLDAGCGRGHALLAMAERFPDSTFVGYDLCNDAIEYARAEARQRGLDNIRFEARDLTGLDEPAHYHLVTSFDAVHDQKDPQGLLNALHRALMPGGVHLMQDIGGSARLENNLDFPMASLLYAVSCTHCTPVSLGQGGAGLGTMWGWETAEGMLKTAGFASVERHVLAHDPMNVWFVNRRGD